MSSFSVVVLVGNLTRDAQLKYTPSGFPICTFGIAINTRKKSGDQWVDEANFFDVELFGKSAESLNQYLTKGKMVGIEGELRQDRWEQDGQSRSKVKIVASKVNLLGGSGREGSYDRGASQGSSSTSGNGDRQEEPDRQQAPRARPVAPNSPPPVSDDFSDDIPF
jgi:single-strand DNA-binding protein